MKKIAKVIITAALISTMNLTALAAEIPGESVPPHVTVNQVAITEKLISPILCEVENGLGYGEANGKAKRLVWEAIVSGQAQGYGYGDLMAIARNAIHQQRDMYLRPDFYKEAEAQMQIVITRLIVFPLFGLNGMLATLIFSFFIGGAIGGIILMWRLLVALYYIPLTAVRFVAAR